MMKMDISTGSKIALILLASCVAGAVALVKAQQRPATEITVGASDVGGVQQHEGRRGCDHARACEGVGGQEYPG